MKRIHGDPVALWQRHGLQQFPPVPCEFKLNDKVIFTNDFGVSFVQTVIGFAAAENIFNGRFVHAISDTWEGSAG